MLTRPGVRVNIITSTTHNEGLKMFDFEFIDDMVIESSSNDVCYGIDFETGESYMCPEPRTELSYMSARFLNEHGVEFYKYDTAESQSF